MSDDTVDMSVVVKAIQRWMAERIQEGRPICFCFDCTIKGAIEIVGYDAAPALHFAYAAGIAHLSLKDIRDGGARVRIDWPAPTGAADHMTRH